MRRALIACVCLLWAWPVSAQVVHGNLAESHGATTGSTSEASFTWNQDVGTAQGVWACVMGLSSASIDVTSVTFDGTNVPAVTNGEATDGASEPGFAKLFFLGSSVPTGNKAWVVNRNNNANVMYAISAYVTAGGNTEIVGNPVLLQGDGTLDEQNVDDGSPGTNSMRYACGFSGLASAPLAGANSTLGPSIDTGSVIGASAFETSAGQGSRPIGFSNGGTDDRAMLHFGIKQSAGAGSTNCKNTLLLGVGGSCN